MEDSANLPPVPVVCAACRTALAEDSPEHEAIAELLSFDPVPVRAHCNNWTPAHQRGFIAALAITGSTNKAARAVGRFPFGADRLRKARGGTSFAMAWDAALDLCRRTELAVMGADLKALKEADEADRLRPRSVFVRSPRNAPSLRARVRDEDDIFDETEMGEELDEAMERITMRLKNARRLFLLTIADDRKKRRAWELLVGPVDWDRVDELHDTYARDVNGIPRMTDPSMVIPTEAGMLPDLTGEEAHPAIKFFQAIGKAADTLTGEERDAIAAHIDVLRDGGWVQQDDGSWRKPAIAPDPAEAKTPTPRDRPGPRLRVIE